MYLQGYILAYNHNKLILVYKLADGKKKVVKSNITTFENKRFLEEVKKDLQKYIDMVKEKNNSNNLLTSIEKYDTM